MYNMVRNASNPAAMLNQVLSMNPYYNKLQSVLSQYNGNVKDAYYATAKQMGVNPDQFISALR